MGPMEAQGEIVGPMGPQGEIVGPRAHQGEIVGPMGPPGEAVVCYCGEANKTYIITYATMLSGACRPLAWRFWPLAAKERRKRPGIG